MDVIVLAKGVVGLFSGCLCSFQSMSLIMNEFSIPQTETTCLVDALPWWLVYEKPVQVVCLQWHMEPAQCYFERTVSCQLMGPLVTFLQSILSLPLHEFLITLNHYFSWKLRGPFCKIFVSCLRSEGASWQKLGVFLLTLRSEGRVAVEIFSVLSFY